MAGDINSLNLLVHFSIKRGHIHVHTNWSCHVMNDCCINTGCFILVVKYTLNTTYDKFFSGKA